MRSTTGRRCDRLHSTSWRASLTFATAGESDNRGGDMSDVGSRESSLVATFVELTDVLVDDFDVVELLTYLAGRCVEVLGVDAAGMMLASPTGTLQAVASSSEAVRTLELFELQTRQGPCYECFYNATPLANVSLSDALERWPDFAPLALDAGFRSATALPMRVGNTTIGAMNLFRSARADLGVADLIAARAFAHVATIGILQHRAIEAVQVINDQLSAALESRVLIEQAKGMLAERAGVEVEEAFERLRSFARNRNRRLAQVAEGFIGGELALDEILEDGPARSALRHGQVGEGRDGTLVDP
jgi:hypothetical protein